MGSGAVIHPANCSLEMLKKCHYLSNLQQGDGLMCWEKISLPLPCLSQGTKCTLYSNSAKRFQCIAFYLGSHPANSSIQWDHSHDNINVWVKAFYLRSKIQSRTGAPALNGHTVICKKLGIFYQIWWKTNIKQSLILSMWNWAVLLDRSTAHACAESFLVIFLVTKIYLWCIS